MPRVALVALLALAFPGGVAWARRSPADSRGAVELEPCEAEGGGEVLCGTFEVPEDRAHPARRVLTLHLVVVPARAARGAPDPIFYLAGGPGGSAIRQAFRFLESPLRKERDVVLVDQRGTGRSNPLECELPGSASNLQGYLDGDFSRVEPFRSCKRDLRGRARLKLYNSVHVVDDLDAVRAAMGYERINLIGESWGSRTGLVYLRRHPESVRAAILKSLVPIAVTYPLYHARGAQEALESVFEECARDAGCAAAFPDPEADLRAALGSLREHGVPVTVSHPDTRVPVEVELTAKAFGEGIRWLMFGATEWLPYLVHLAAQGNWVPITQFTIDYAHFLGGLKMGFLMSEVCSTDVPRIDPAEIPTLTDGTFMGDTRVREVMRACEVWPRGKLPPGFGEPVASEVPVLLWSGTFDSACRPEWAEEAARHLGNSLHVVVDEAHVPSGACVDRVGRRFLNRASARGLRRGCARKIRLPPFALPGGGAGAAGASR